MGSMLVVEADGGQHYSNPGVEADAKRDAYLRERGFTVLRFSNRDIATNIEGVLQMIEQYVEEAKQTKRRPPIPPLQGEGA
jgi:very-short-patch-repair endonuclease